MPPPHKGAFKTWLRPGMTVRVERDGEWYAGEVLDVAGDACTVVYAEDASRFAEPRVASSRIRSLNFAKALPGMAVESGIATNTSLAVRSFDQSNVTRQIGLMWRKKTPRRVEFRQLGELIAELANR